MQFGAGKRQHAVDRHDRRDPETAHTNGAAQRIAEAHRLPGATQLSSLFDRQLYLVVVQLSQPRRLRPDRCKCMALHWARSRFRDICRGNMFIVS